MMDNIYDVKSQSDLHKFLCNNDVNFNEFYGHKKLLNIIFEYDDMLAFHHVVNELCLITDCKLLFSSIKNVKSIECRKKYIFESFLNKNFARYIFRNACINGHLDDIDLLFENKNIDFTDYYLFLSYIPCINNKELFDKINNMFDVSKFTNIVSGKKEYDEDTIKYFTSHRYQFRHNSYFV